MHLEPVEHTEWVKPQTKEVEEEPKVEEPKEKPVELPKPVVKPEFSELFEKDNEKIKEEEKVVEPPHLHLEPIKREPAVGQDADEKEKASTTGSEKKLLSPKE